MKSDKNKSIFYFLFFLLFLLLLGWIFNPSGKKILPNLEQKIISLEKMLGFDVKESGIEPYGQKYITQEVVQEESEVINVVDKVSPAVVSVVVKTLNYDPYTGPISDESGIGTGFIVDKGGLIVTNSHVVSDVNGLYSVVLKNGTSYEVEKIHMDKQNDLAILEVSARDLPTTIFGDSDKLKVGQKAIAIGNALGQFQNTVTVGVVSGIGRSITASDGFGTEQKLYESVIQTDAAINPGNSGGPLLNIAGQVIGINVATSTRADNISFAIPVNSLKPILEGFIKEGRIIKPYLGVSYSMISKEISIIRRLPQGAFVSRVAKDTPAASAGLESGDIITMFNGKELSIEYSLSQAISRQKVGDEITLTIDRLGKIIELKAKLKEMPQDL